MMAMLRDFFDASLVWFNAQSRLAAVVVNRAARYDRLLHTSGVGQCSGGCCPAGTPKLAGITRRDVGVDAAMPNKPCR